MILQDAIRSGKRFRRRGEQFFCYKPIDPHTSEQVYLIRDILAEDWEIEEERVEITAGQLKTALNNAYYQCHEVNRHQSLFQALSKELGFKN